MSNPDIFGPVGTIWNVDFSRGAGILTPIELRKDAPDHRVYKRTYQGGHVTREKANKGLCIGGPYDGKALTDTDLWIVGMRHDYLGFSRSDSIHDNPLAQSSLLGRVWLHKSYGDKE